mmetsp:Transcript_93570/g.274036  ORF Transcript_93570/g.274036 Transcript_93570/m.274036 type:complete len:210 (+) Transcript_93570:82-711(+)
MDPSSPAIHSSVSLGLVGSPPCAGTIDVRVDRQSVLGNPFYDAWPVEKWLEDCEAYRDFLEAALTGVSEPLAVVADAIATCRSVTVHRRWRQHPPAVEEVQSEISRLSALLCSGHSLRLLCHCARPFRELGGRQSPCHAEIIAHVLRVKGSCPPGPCQDAAPLTGIRTQLGSEWTDGGRDGLRRANRSASCRQDDFEHRRGRRRRNCEA